MDIQCPYCFYDLLECKMTLEPVQIMLINLFVSVPSKRTKGPGNLPLRLKKEGLVVLCSFKPVKTAV